jgi:predicted O-methyltransferase YrrM
MNKILEEIYRTCRSETPDGRTVKIGGHVSIQEGHFLQGLIRQLRPTVTLEVGLANGVSALFICDALKEASGERHIVIDPAQNAPSPTEPVSSRGIGLHNLKRAGFESKVEFFEEPSFRVLPQLEMQGRVIDFAFIDGWTTFDFKLVDFFYIDRLLRVGGIVVVRVGWTPAGRKVCKYVATNLSHFVPCGVLPATSEAADFETDDLLGLSRERIDLVVFRKEGEDTREWREHFEF